MPPLGVNAVSLSRNLVGMLLCSLLLGVSCQSGTGLEDGDSSAIYIVHIGRFPPAVTYEGGIKGYTATSPASASTVPSASTGDSSPRPRLDCHAPHVKAYTGFLAGLHGSITGSLNISESKIMYSYGLLLNAFAAALTPSEARQLQSHRLVSAVQRSQRVALARHQAQAAPVDASPFLQMEELWRGVGGQAKAGAGVVVGVIDTGIWPENRFFRDADFAAASPPPSWTGTCNATEDFPASLCNRKLIGASFFYQGALQFGQLNLANDYLSPRDADGHGSWCASAAAGSRKTTVILNGVKVGRASGMAPRAFLAAYKVFWTTTNGLLTQQAADVDIYAAVEQAVADGVDVISRSFGGPTEDLIASGQYIFLNAARAGVFVSFAAGNDGAPPLASDFYPTVSNFAPWYLTVGASTIGRTASATLSYGSVRLHVPSVIATPGASRSHLVLSSDCGAEQADPTQVALCYPGTLDPYKCRGKIIFCDRGIVLFRDKSAAVQAAGGAGIIIGNVPNGRTTQFAVDAAFPSANVLLADATAIKEYIGSTKKPTASISAAVIITGLEAPQLAAFSSRGPVVDPSQRGRSNRTNDILKPDVIGPGVELLGASAGQTLGQKNVFSILSGTSMSTPHLAGIAANIIQKHSDWSPAQVKSAIMTTAYQAANTGKPITDTSGSSTTPWDIGSGHANAPLVLNPGLTYDIGFTDYVNFLYGVQPDLAPLVYPGNFQAITPYELNYPNIVVSNATQQVITVPRTVTNVGGEDATYWASVEEPKNAKVTVVPSTLSIKANATATLHVTFRVTETSNDFHFGSLTWKDGKGHAVRSVLGLQAVSV